MESKNLAKTSLVAKGNSFVQQSPSRSRTTVQAKQCPLAPGVLAGRRRRGSSSRELFSGEVLPIRQQQPPGPRPQAHGAHGRGSQDGACGVWNDQEEPALPAVLQAEFAQRIDPSQQGRRGADLRSGTP